MDFKVFEPPDKKDKFEKLAHKLFRTKSRINLIGQSGSGKTQFMMNILFNWNLNYYKKSKAHIVFMSGTEDTMYHIAKLAHQHKYDHKLFDVMQFDMDELKEIYENHDGLQSPLVIVLDDAAFLKGFSSPYKKNLLSKIFASGRHKNTTIITSLQKYFFLSEDCRSVNTTHLVIYDLNQKEANRFYEENLSKIMDKEQFFSIMRKYLNEQYKFIILDCIKKKLYDNKGNEITIECSKGHKVINDENEDT